MKQEMVLYGSRMRSLGRGFRQSHGQLPKSLVDPLTPVVSGLAAASSQPVRYLLYPKCAVPLLGRSVGLEHTPGAYNTVAVSTLRL